MQECGRWLQVPTTVNVFSLDQLQRDKWCVAHAVDILRKLLEKFQKYLHRRTRVVRGGCETMRKFRSSSLGFVPFVASQLRW